MEGPEGGRASLLLASVPPPHPQERTIPKLMGREGFLRRQSLRCRAGYHHPSRVPLSLLAQPQCTFGAPFWPDLTPHTGCQQRGQGRPHRLGQEAGALGTVYQRALVENS